MKRGAEVRDVGAEAGTPNGPEPLLKAEGLTLGYGAKTVLRGIDLEIRRGERWFLLGPNGSGKTTFLHAVLRLLPCTAGRLWTHPVLASRERTGFVPQRSETSSHVPTTVREFVRLGFVGTTIEPAQRASRLARTLERVGLGGMEAGDYWTLSGGMQQRARLARALVRRPQLLVLDEPTAALDPASRASLLELLVELNATERLTLLFVTHEPEVARRYATHVALVHGGRVVAGRRDVVLSPDYLRDIYGADFEPRPDVGSAAATRSPGGSS